MQSTSRRHRYPPTRRSELLLGIAQKSSLCRPRLSGFLGMPTPRHRRTEFQPSDRRRAFRCNPQHMKVIELFATDPLQLLDGSAVVGGVDGLRFLNQRLIQTRAGTFNARRSASLSTRTVAFSPLSSCSADFAMPFGGRGARLVIS